MVLPRDVPRTIVGPETVGRIRVLSLSIVFPNAITPTKGVFVRSRLQQLAAGVDLHVIAPVPVFDYGNIREHWNALSAIPIERTDGRLRIHHPRWAYPPFGSFVNALCLFAELLWPVGRLMRTFHFDLIDAHFGYPEGIAAWLLSRFFGIPFVITLRGNEIVHSKKHLVHWLMSWAFQRASRVITVSSDLARFAALLGADPANIRVIPNGVDQSIFFRRNKTEVRSKHGIAATKLILSAGTLVTGKGHHHVIRAVYGLRQRGIPAQLVIAGGAGTDRSYPKRLVDLVSAMELTSVVRFTGQLSVETLAELMCAADVLALASSREGWPNVVHEALACGTPVVATDVGAVREMLADQMYGFVVPPGDTAALEGALYEALRRRWDYSAISAWGQSRSWEQVAIEVLNELRQVCPQNWSAI